MRKFLCTLGIMLSCYLFSAAHAVDNINKAIANSNVKKILFLFLLKILKMEKLFMS